MISKIIAFPGRQISNIAELAKADGTRNIGYIYFVDNPNVSYWQAVAISDQTDSQILQDQIAKGMIYIISEL